MKKVLIIAMLLAISMSGFAQRQKVTVGKDGEMIVNGDTVAYIEKEGCKLLSSTCQFFISNENNDLLITITQQSFTDKDKTTPQRPNGVPVVYLVFSFNGYQDVAEIESPLILKEETVAKLITRWNLIKDKRLNPEGIEHFINANGCKYSEKERRQSQPPTIQVVQPQQVQ